LDDYGKLGRFGGDDLLEIEPACSGTEVEFIGGAVVGTFATMGKVLLVICSERSLRVGVEGFEPGGELDACWVDGMWIADMVA
jgi:hypothetical protein